MLSIRTTRRVILLLLYDISFVRKTADRRIPRAGASASPTSIANGKRPEPTKPV
jgi:hypothetical protein